MLRYYQLTKKLLGIYQKNQDYDKITRDDAKVIFHKIYDDIRVNIYGSPQEKPRLISNPMIDEFEYFSMNFYLMEKHYYDVEEMIAKGQVIHSYSPRDEDSIQESFEEVVTYIYLHSKRVNNSDLTHTLSMNFYKILKEQCGLCEISTPS
jgi:hypothetical protein